MFMSFTNSSLTSYTRISPNKNIGRYYDYQSDKPVQRVTEITKITIHHMAGIMSVEEFGNLVANPGREMSANYCIGSDGRIGLFCEEKDRSWCSSSPWNDNRAITIEVSNCKIGGDWAISETVYESLIKLCADICKRNGIKKLEFTGDKNGSLTYHYMFASTACPGTWIKNHTNDICNRVNALLNNTNATNNSINIKPNASKDLYRIRKSFDNVASQIGAYSDLENAKKACKEGYTVFDGKGNAVYSKITNTYSTKSNTKPKADIVGLQKILNIGGANLVVDGILGEKTLGAVKKYTVQFNDTGNLIKWVQQRLNQLGYSCGNADGIAGNQTMSAISKFQSANKLGVGYLGGTDWDYLLKG
jgi:N-acetyl-anhydromuramyl-L-alanine amidase AmpD